jgi:D-cysteine desulfhydrase
MNNSKVGKDMRCFRGKPWKSDQVTLIKEYASEEYATVTQEITNTIKLMARTEGIILDPVYTGRAMAGLIDMTKKQPLQKG